MMPRATLVLGLVAVVTLLGITSFLPTYIAFFIGSLAIVLFPGMTVLRLIMIVLPFLVCGLVLMLAYGPIAESLEAKQFPEEIGFKIRWFFPLYFPGDPFPLTAERVYASVIRLTERFWISNPLYITRYPLAVAGLILTFLLIPHFKPSFSAGFLMSVTFSILFLAFTPIGTRLTARLITWKMVFRLSWVLPWGLTIAFFLSRMKLRPLCTWLLVLLVVFALPRGDPQNYIQPLLKRTPYGGPDLEAVAALGVLGSEPSPQGIVLASPRISRLIAAHLPDAYPASYRGSGPLARGKRRKLLISLILTQSVILEIKQMRCKYILLENDLPLAQALARDDADFPLIYRNSSYSLWKVTEAVPRETPPPIDALCHMC